MAKMVAADAAWCRHYGKRGKAGDKERRNIKRGKAGNWKRQEARDQN